MIFELIQFVQQDIYCGQKFVNLACVLWKGDVYRKSVEEEYGDAKMAKDLLTILLSQAQQVSDHQHLSFSIFAPILRKIRMLDTMMDHFKIEERKKHIEMKIEPMQVDSAQIAAKISPLVKVK